MEHGIFIIRDKPWLFMLSGFLGFGVNFSSIWVTQTNSAVTLQIVVSIRNIVVVAISVLAGEHISLVKFLGFSIVLIGAYMYREAKRWEEMETKRKKEGVAMNDESLV
jgi:drug/metabolite transporter (DMT)-like permease